MDSNPNEGYNSIVQDNYDFQRIHLPEIDGAILTELLNDTPSTMDAENERLDFVMRSFEEEIEPDSGLVFVGDDESTTGPHDLDDCDIDGGLELGLNFDNFDKNDMISNDGGMYTWMEMENVGSTENEWYYAIGEGEKELLGFGLGEDQRECYIDSFYNYEGGISCMEQVYSTNLWE